MHVQSFNSYLMYYDGIERKLVQSNMSSLTFSISDVILNSVS